MIRWAGFIFTGVLASSALWVALVSARFVVTFVGRKPSFGMWQLLRSRQDVATHPERYVRSSRVGLVRSIDHAATLAWFVAFVFVACEVLARGLSILARALSVWPS